MILSLPLISILAFIWLWWDTSDKEGIAALAQSTFWFILPTLPMFLVLPALLRGGASFWTALGLSCLLTISLYAATAWTLGKLGISFRAACYGSIRSPQRVGGGRFPERYAYLAMSLPNRAGRT